MKKVTFLDDFLRSWFSFAKFREINFYFRINFVFREIEKVPFVSTLAVIQWLTIEYFFCFFIILTYSTVGCQNKTMTFIIIIIIVLHTFFTL
jgi:hypothetical protein